MMIETLYTFNGIPWLWILLSLRYSNQRYLKLKGKCLLLFAKCLF